MTERYQVRCTSAKGREMAGMYAISLTGKGMVATWKPELASLLPCRADAERLASRISSNFSGTVWAVVPVGVAQ